MIAWPSIPASRSWTHCFCNNFHRLRWLYFWFEELCTILLWLFMVGSQCFPERLNQRDAAPYNVCAQGGFLPHRLSKMVSIDFLAQSECSLYLVQWGVTVWWLLVVFIAWSRFELKYLRELKTKFEKQSHFERNPIMSWFTKKQPKGTMLLSPFNILLKRGAKSLRSAKAKRTERVHQSQV